MESSWGGKRKGSGRKKINVIKKLRTYSFLLSEEHLNIIEMFKGKNRSEKLRNLINKIIVEKTIDNFKK